MIYKILSIIFLILLSHPASARDIDIGYAKDNTNITDTEKEYRVNFTHQLIYQKINNLHYSEVRRILDTGNDCIINIEFMNTVNDPANLNDIINGKYDKQLIKFLNDSKKDGRHFQIRTLHEFNGNWYPWSIYKSGNTKDEFIQAWNHVTNLIRESNANVSIQLNYNQVSYRNDYTFEEMYPENNIDKIIITTYNRAGTDEDHKQWKSLDDNFDKPYNEIISFTDKPIGIAEISTTSHGGCKPLWILQTSMTIDKKYDRVDEVTWFLNNKRVNGYNWDWDMNNAIDKFTFMISNTIINT